MPQLVKGGKYVFGWVNVSPTGIIKIPYEARKEYQLNSFDRLFILSGSTTSGGFSIIQNECLKNSSLSLILQKFPNLAQFKIANGEPIKYHHHYICWTELSEKEDIHLPVKTIQTYDISPGDMLLSVRGSSLGVGFIHRGPIIQEAKKHPEIPCYY